jgi:hypothetical protein
MTVAAHYTAAMLCGADCQSSCPTGVVYDKGLALISTFQTGSALCQHLALQDVPRIFLLVFPTHALEIVENENRGKHLFRVVQTLDKCHTNPLTHI